MRAQAPNLRQLSPFFQSLANLEPKDDRPSALQVFQEEQRRQQTPVQPYTFRGSSNVRAQAPGSRVLSPFYAEMAQATREQPKREGGATQAQLWKEQQQSQVELSQIKTRTKKLQEMVRNTTTMLEATQEEEQRPTEGQHPELETLVIKLHRHPQELEEWDKKMKEAEQKRKKLKTWNPESVNIEPILRKLTSSNLSMLDRLVTSPKGFEEDQFKDYLVSLDSFHILYNDLIGALEQQGNLFRMMEEIDEGTRHNEGVTDDLILMMEQDQEAANEKIDFLLKEKAALQLQVKKGLLKPNDYQEIENKMREMHAKNVEEIKKQVVDLKIALQAMTSWNEDLQVEINEMMNEKPLQAELNNLDKQVKSILANYDQCKYDMTLLKAENELLKAELVVLQTGKRKRYTPKERERCTFKTKSGFGWREKGWKRCMSERSLEAIGIL
jgi:hypothetical protein